MVNHNTNSDELNLNSVEDDIKALVGVRGIDRQKNINIIAFKLHRCLKQLGYKTIDKKFFNSFFVGIPTRTSQNIRKEILNYLFDKRKFSVKKKTLERTRYLRVIDGGLMSKDDESYKVMMSKNGFKSYAYKYGYDKFKRIPTRKLISVHDINAIPDDVLKQADLIDNKTHKARKHIGVYGVVEKSIRHEQNKHDAIVYAIN